MERLIEMPPPVGILDNGKLYAQVYGNGFPLLMIHGNYGSGQAFSKLIPVLSQHFRLILPDLPKHGNGPASLVGFVENPQVSVDYCIKILKYFNVRACHVCGHSLGGMIALLLSEVFPLTSIALLDSYVDINERPPGFTNFHFPDCEPRIRNKIDEAMNYGPGVDWHYSFNYSEQAKRIKCPVLELQGESAPNTDKEFLNWQKEKRADFPQNWKITRVPKSGHFIQIEQPNFVLERLTEFWNLNTGI